MSEREEWKHRKDWQEQLYQRYHRRVYGICLYFLKDREEARDASHDVYLKAFRGWEEFEWKCDPMTWLGAIAKHDCFSRLQKNKKQFERREQMAYAEVERQLPESDDELVLHKVKLEKCLPAVRGKLREILRLNLEQGLNHREIAVRMGVSRVAITRRLTRFKRDLQEMQAAKGLSLVKRRSAAKPRMLEPMMAEAGQPMAGEPGLRLRAA